MDKIETIRRELQALRSEKIKLETTRDGKPEKKFSEEEAKAYAEILNKLSAKLEELKTEEKALEIETALSAIPAGKEPAPRIEVVQTKDKYSFGEMLRDVALFATGKPIAARLDKHEKEIRMVTGMGESVPSEGGFLVGTDFGQEIVQHAYDEGQIASLCARQQLGANSNSYKLRVVDESSRADGYRYGGIASYWEGEGATLTASKAFKPGQIDWNLHKLTLLCPVSDELMQDTVALESQIRRTAEAELKFKLDDAIVNGDGSGKPIGILKAPCLVTVTKETGQVADTVISDNIDKMWSRMPGASRRRAVWLANDDCFPQFRKLGVAVGTGGVPIWTPAGGISAAPYENIYARPVMYVEQAQALGDAGDLILADMSQYLLVEKLGIQFASSMHVYFTTDEMAFRFILRIDGGPMWKSAVTPKNSSNTKSPFVALGAR